MEDRGRHRPEANQVRVGPHRAPRDCALGMPALHTRPVGWATTHTHGIHPVPLCQWSLPSPLQQLLPLLSPHALPCEQAALQRCSHSFLRGISVASRVRPRHRHATLALQLCCSLARSVKLRPVPQTTESCGQPRSLSRAERSQRHP